MTRYAKLTPVSLVILAAACNALKHADAELEAQDRWNHMRSRVKYQLAEQQYEGGLFDDAVRTVTESIGLDPNQADAFALLVQANLELGKPGSARRALEAAHREGVTSADLIYLEGVFLELRNQLEAAVKKYTEARSLDPGNVDYLVAQAECLVALDRPDKAMELLRDSADRLDDDATVPVLTAHVAALLGDAEEASRRYEQALIVGGSSRVVAEELGTLLVRAGRYEQALAILSPLQEAPPDGEVHGAAARALAICHLALGDPKSAKRALLDYARQHPDDALAQLLLAKAAVASGDTLTALHAVDIVQRHEPDRPELWLVRATVQWKRGNLAAAAADLYDVLANDPNDVDAHCLLGEVLRGRRQFDAARNHFEQALQIEPDCAWATAGLEGVRKAESQVPERPSVRLTSAIEWENPAKEAEPAKQERAPASEIPPNTTQDIDR